MLTVNVNARVTCADIRCSITATSLPRRQTNASSSWHTCRLLELRANKSV